MTKHEPSPLSAEATSVLDEATGEGRIFQRRRGGIVTYIATVTFTVSDYSDEHLQNVQAIKAEIESWLESLDATVHAVTVDAE